MSDVGLYDDKRFPGRLLLSLRDHYDHLDEVPDGLLTDLTRDIKHVSRVLRDGLGADRVNVAVLGNLEPHVHAHVIPRYQAREPLPARAPWQDPRPLIKFATEELDRVISDLSEKLALHSR